MLETRPPQEDLSDHAPFREHHQRVTSAPPDAVWSAAREVTVGEIGILRSLMTLRNLPARVRAGEASGGIPSEVPLLDVFASEGFLCLEVDDDRPADRSIRYGAVGRFWSPIENEPVQLSSPEEFRVFAEPGYARLEFEVRVRAEADRVRLSTTTWVDGTDRSARRRFAFYWALIRFPSGLIRRSWLAAIDRRAMAAC